MANRYHTGRSIGFDNEGWSGKVSPSVGSYSHYSVPAEKMSHDSEEVANQYEGEEDIEYEPDDIANGETIDRYYTAQTGISNPADAAETEEDAMESSTAPYSLDTIDAKVVVSSTPSKGRCLYTKKALSPGEIIFVEAPVLVAIPSLNPELWNVLKELNEAEAFELPPIWHLAAICSLTMVEFSKQQMVDEKWVPDPEKDASEDVIRVLQNINLSLNPQKYEKFLQAWRYNSFGHHTESDGLVLYNRISMMAHSCSATACWHYGDSDAFVLRARQYLPAGAELTISYIGDDDLFKCLSVRREKLSGWLFVCHCIRCDEPVDRARGFRCPFCGVGTVFFTQISDDSEESSASTCTVCFANLTADKIEEYIGFETAYITRLDDTSKEDMEDAELVFQEAQRVFTQHWIMYQLHTMLFEGYRENRQYDKAALHQRRRREYALEVNPKASYTMAWMNEELADMESNRVCPGLLDSAADDSRQLSDSLSSHDRNTLSRLYEDAMNLLLILCGEEHDYTLSAHRKLELVCGEQGE